ncbi:MAG: hypothetical protein CMP20_09295 [Rickettsiales bacterium]|nr:hypothetical protein [Rickettsiales bacterium]
MRLDELPPEVLHQLAYTGWLSYLEIINLACSSEALFEKLTGDDYSKRRLRVFVGPYRCVDQGWTKALKLYASMAKMSMRWVLQYIARKGKLEVMKELVDDPFICPNQYALWSAISYGQTEMVDFLMTLESVDPAFISASDIGKAMMHGRHNAICAFLHSDRVDPKLRERFPRYLDT